MNAIYSLLNKKNAVRLSLAIACAAAFSFLAQPAKARLGTFNSNDGYQLSIFQSPGGTYNWADVSYYNAGAYGVNAGGGPGPTLSTPNSGKWKILGQPGGFFANSAMRNSYVSSAPPYPNPVLTDTANAYVVGGHFPGHFNDGNNLALRNMNPVGTGPLIYGYTIDQYDMGVNPTTVTSGVVSTEFYFSPSNGVPSSSGGPASDKFHLSFGDSSNNFGVEWGFQMDSEMVWRTAPGPWNNTGIIARDQSIANPTQDWDGIKVNINLTNDTFGIDYYKSLSALWVPLVPAGTPLGTPMANLSRLKWQMEDNVYSGFFGKNYFDDFTFKAPAVPEPATFVLAGGALAGLLGTRRKR